MKTAAADDADDDADINTHTHTQGMRETEEVEEVRWIESARAREK